MFFYVSLVPAGVWVIVNCIYPCTMRTFFPLKIKNMSAYYTHACKGKYGNGLVAPLFSIFYVIHEFDGILHRG